jgi:hypothetical protein
MGDYIIMHCSLPHAHQLTHSPTFSPIILYFIYFICCYMCKRTSLMNILLILSITLNSLHLWGLRAKRRQNGAHWAGACATTKWNGETGERKGRHCLDRTSRWQCCGPNISRAYISSKKQQRKFTQQLLLFMWPGHATAFRDCTVAKAHTEQGDTAWDLSVDDLEAFI